VFWVISVYFNIRNTLPKFCPFLLGQPVYQYNLWYMVTLCRWPFRVQVGKFLTCTRNGHRHIVTCTRDCIDIIDLPDDEHRVARNMKRTEINTWERIVRQVGHLPKAPRVVTPHYVRPYTDIRVLSLHKLIQ